MPRTAGDREVAKILEPPPKATRAELERLEAALDEKVPDKVVDRNLLIATWNVRAFGELTTEWERSPDDDPMRNLSDVLAIAEILSRFDVIAVQEVRSNLRALRHVLKALGPDWGFVLTDVNRSHSGNYERLAFLYDTRFIYGSGASDRTDELHSIAEWLADWAKRTKEDFSQNLICLGDFNIDREDDANYKALTSTGLRPPAELARLSRSIYDAPGEPHHYDQIAWFREKPGGRKSQLTLGYEGRGHGGRFAWTKHLLNDAKMTNDEKAAHISDHYPLWVEFGI